MQNVIPAEPVPAWRFILRKGLEIAVVLLGATFFMFLLSHIIPGDPIRALFGFRPPPPELLAELRNQYGLDDPFFIQYVKYLRNLAQGEMGYSVYGAPVSGIIARGLPISLRLLAATVTIQVIIGIGAAVVATLFNRRFVSVLIQGTALLILTVPIFAIAYTMQGVFGQQLRWFPTWGLFGGWRSFVLPAFTLAVVSTAIVVRMAHVQMLDTMDAPFIKTQQANGIPRSRIVGVHALRASLAPIVTLIAATTSQVITGLIIVETIFQIPGVGYSVYEAIRAKDHNVIVGILVVAVFFVVLINLAADILNSIIDPRIRLE
jgi:oligopeptide transport system permease protein